MTGAMKERPAPPARKSSAKPAAPAERPRGRGVRAVGDMLPEVGRMAFRKFGFVQSSVVSRWPEIVGPRYADVSTPESIRFPPGQRSEGVLTLAVEGGHAPMMQHVAPTIIERVNRFFGYGAVARVTIRQGVARRPVPPPRRIAPQPVPVELGDSLRTIADPELRDCLAALAGALATSDPVAIRIEGKVK
jgi:hypothetical protein